MAKREFRALPKRVQSQLLECDGSTIRMALMAERARVARHTDYRKRRLAEIQHLEHVDTYRSILMKIEPFMRKHYEASWRAERHLAPISNIHIY